MSGWLCLQEQVASQIGPAGGSWLTFDPGHLSHVLESQRVLMVFTGAPSSVDKSEQLCLEQHERTVTQDRHRIVFLCTKDPSFSRLDADSGQVSWLTPVLTAQSGTLRSSGS